MSRLHLLVLVTVTTLACLSGTPQAGEPAVESIVDDSNRLDTAQFEGSVVYLDFWASWCKPCRKSFGWMRQMHETYADAGLVIIAIGLDNDAAEAYRFLDRVTPPFRIVLDPQARMAAAYDLEGMPCSFLFDRDGAVHSTHVGYVERDRDMLERRIRSALGLEPATAPSLARRGASK